MTDAAPPAPDGAAAKTVAPKPRSSITFPYYSLDKSIDVARVIHERAGGRCGREQLAAFLGYSGVKNGGFLTRISAAKQFGLIDEVGDSISLSERARKILSPVRPADAEQARLDAFMAVELYRRVFTDFEGQTLPAKDGLSNAFLTTYKVVPNQVQPALRNLTESAEAAGLFKVGGRSKLIRPIINGASHGGAAATPAPPADSPPDEEHGHAGQHASDARRDRHGGHAGATSGHGGGRAPANELAGVHPALAGLIQTLPPIGSALGPKRRAALIDAFKHTVNFIYPEEEE